MHERFLISLIFPDELVGIRPCKKLSIQSVVLRTYKHLHSMNHSCMNMYNHDDRAEIVIQESN
jgi:hypothetical protein